MTLSILLNEARALKSSYVLLDRDSRLYGFDEGLYVVSMSSRTLDMFKGHILIFNVLDLFNLMKTKVPTDMVTIQEAEEHTYLEADIRNLLFKYHTLRYKIDKLNHIVSTVPIEYQIGDLQNEACIATALNTNPKNGVVPYRYHEAILYIFKGLLPVLKGDKLSVTIYNKYGYGNLVVFHIDKKPKKKKDPWWSIDVAMNCLFPRIE